MTTIDDALARCMGILLQNWRDFPADLQAELKTELRAALERAGKAPVEVVTVSDATSRPLPLRLTILAADYSADEMYRREWVEFAIEARGTVYLIYRFKNGEDHAVTWMPSVSLPDGLMRLFSPALATAVLGTDQG